MHTHQPKKLMIINILDILKKYTDAEHRLSQKDISDILENEYYMKSDRKSIKRNLMNLIDFGYDIEYSESIRIVKNKKTGEDEETYILSDFYLRRDFDDSELRLLIDSILFSKHIPYSQCKELIEKLEGLSNIYFKSKVKHILTLPEKALINKQLFYTIDVIDEAISKSRQISFKYNEYGTDKKLHVRKNCSGTEKEYIINPYQMAVANGRYYLICNYDKYDGLSNYRLDRITDIKLLDTPRKPLKAIKGAENGLDLPKHMAEHIYMYAGESVRVEMRVKKYIVSDVIDWFGRDVEFRDETDDEVTAVVHVNEAAMRKWALQYAVHVRVLSPQSLVDGVREDIKTAAENYNL